MAGHVKALDDVLPGELSAAVSSFGAAVNEIEEKVKLLLQAPWHELCRGLSPLESARLHLMVAYTVNTLFYMYLKTQGIPASNHPVREELERVKNYIRKVKEVSQEAEKASEDQKRQLKLNESAAQRFILHALAGPCAVSSKTEAPSDQTTTSTNVGKTQATSGDGEHATPASEDQNGGSATDRAEERIVRQRAQAVEDSLKRELSKLGKQVASGEDASDADSKAVRDTNVLLLQQAEELGLHNSELSSKAKRKQSPASPSTAAQETAPASGAAKKKKVKMTPKK